MVHMNVLWPLGCMQSSLPSPPAPSSSPLQYLLRDVLQFDQTLLDAEKRMTNAHRTCDLILGVGDGKVGGARHVGWVGLVVQGKCECS